MKLAKSSWIPNLGVKGWGVTAVCIMFYLFYTFWNAVTNTLLGIFTEMYGWAQTDMSFVVTIAGWISLLGIVLFGYIGRKIGAKNVSTIGLFISAISFVILALMDSFLLFAVGVVLFYVSMVAYAIIGVGKLGSNWFPRKKGIFMGMATMGMTLGSAALNPVILACAGSVGVSGFFWGCAAVCVLLAIIVFVFVKNNPEEAGAYPDNDRSISRETLDREFAAAQEYKKNSPWTIARVLKTKETWLIGIGWGLPMLVAGGTIALFVPTIASFGHDILFGVVLLSSMWPMGVLGHYLIGVIDQKIGTKRTTFVVVLIEACAGLLVFFLGSSGVACAIAAGMLMFAISGNANVCMSMTTSVFGRQDFEMAWTPIQIIYNILNYAGISVLAIVAGAFGQQAIMIAGSLICVVGLVFIAVCSDRQIASNIQKSAETQR
jgi:MFS family permease